MADRADIRYVVLLHHITPALLTKALVREHVQYLQELESQGLLQLCGPFPEDQGGMLILRVADERKAHQIAQADPFVAAKAQGYSLRRWELSHAQNGHLGVVAKSP